MRKTTRKKTALTGIFLEDICDKALALAKLPFLSEAHEIEIAQEISTTFGADSIVIRQLLRERAPNNWCTVALRAAPSGPSAVLQLSDGRCPACGCKPYVDKRGHTKHCPCCGRTFARDTGEQIEDQRWLQTAPGLFEDWSFDARVARGETRTLEDLPPTTLSGICAAALTQHGEWSLFPQRGSEKEFVLAEAIKSAHFENDPEMTISRIQNRLCDLRGMKLVAGLLASIAECRQVPPPHFSSRFCGE
jgi:hypothetical protein